MPGNKQSGGKWLAAGITEGGRWLRGTLGEVAWAIVHTKDNYLVAQYHRLVRRRGKYKAIVALMHRVLVVVYHMLRNQQSYRDLGAITSTGWTPRASSATMCAAWSSWATR